MRPSQPPWPVGAAPSRKGCGRAFAGGCSAQVWDGKGPEAVVPPLAEWVLVSASAWGQGHPREPQELVTLAGHQGPVRGPEGQPGLGVGLGPWHRVDLKRRPVPKPRGHLLPGKAPQLSLNSPCPPSIPEFLLRCLPVAGKGGSQTAPGTAAEATGCGAQGRGHGEAGALL